MDQTEGGSRTPDSSDGTRGPVIEVQGVSKRFPRAWALKQVDLRVEPGELVCLLGPNGSGKSTLLRIVTNVARATRGTVDVFGRSTGSSDEVRRRIGFLSQQTYLYGELTARENLRFAAVMYGLPPSAELLDGSLADVGLTYAADAQVRTFSSGMRKRLALARATLHDPDLVLLDEPYGALDVDGIDWVDRFIRGLRAAGKTALVATHETGRALELCDRAIALRAGRKTYDGPTETFEPEAAGLVEVSEVEAGD